jgi:polyhydroxybutyrate depolymerase
VDDVAFTKALLAKLESTWCIDRKHIHATGMSNGGFFSHRLACEMADTIASVAPVAGVLGIEPAACNPSRPIPVLDIHGTDDNVCQYEGGTPILPIDLGPVLAFRSVPDTVMIWRQKNGCLGSPTTIFQKGDATCTRFGGCQAGVEVVHCAIDGGGHTWPGGVPVPHLGKTSTSISATETMVAFFQAHPLP